MFAMLFAFFQQLILLLRYLVLWASTPHIVRQTQQQTQQKKTTPTPTDHHSAKDANILINRLRLTAQQHAYSFSDAMPVEQLVTSICHMAESTKALKAKQVNYQHPQRSLFLVAC